jgi:folate-binding Fe-S cluster repair protein YgfZ
VHKSSFDFALFCFFFSFIDWLIDDIMDSFRSLLAPRVCVRSPSRSLLRVVGADKAKFLQGLFTNDVVAFSKDSNMFLQWNSLLNAKGKVVIPDLFLVKMRSMALDHKYRLHHSNIDKNTPDIYDKGEFLLDCPSSDFGHLFKFLERHKLRSDVQMVPVDPRDLQVRIIFGGNPSDDMSRLCEMSDARNVHLGHRIYCGSDAEISELWGRDVHVLSCGEEETGDALARYSAIRMGVGQAEGSLEIGKGVMNVFESNLFSSVDAHSSVSFKKGCFLGQERIGRKKRLKAVPTSKRLTGLAWADEPIGSSLVQGAPLFGIIEGKRVPCGIVHASVPSKHIAFGTLTVDANDIETEDGKNVERVVTWADWGFTENKQLIGNEMIEWNKKQQQQS